MIKILMFLFNVLVLPGLLIIPCYLRKSYKDYVIPVCFGLVFAVLWALFNNFFIFSVTYYEFSIVKIFVRFLFKCIVLPLVSTGALYFLLVKDPLTERFKGLFPLWTSFFAVIIPYAIISGQTSFSFYEIFFKPVLVACLLVLLKGFIQALVVEVQNKGKTLIKVLFGFLIFSSICACSFIEAVWFTGYPWYAWFIPYVLVAFFTVLSVLRMKSL